NNNINNDIWHTIYKIQKEKQNGYSEKKNNNIYTNIMNDKDGKIYLNTKSIINNYKEYIKNTYIYYNTFFKYVKYFITKIKNYNVIYDEPCVILEQKSKTHISINNKKRIIQFLPQINKGTHILHNKTNDSISNVLNDFHNKLVKRRVLLALMKRKKKDKRKSKLAKKKKLKD
ncbi:hypothetical protein PRSY57_0420500, partial [Plasmodium reichenowi]